MKLLHFECATGAAGDMLCAAIFELLEDKQAFLDMMASLGLHGVSATAETVSSHGISGTRLHVAINGEEEQEEHHHHHHHHSHVSDIYGIIRGLGVNENVKRNAENVYRLIAEAESKAHGVPVEQVHFHEVGALDAVADVVGFCALIDMIKPDRVTASPVTTGSGTVKTAHGVMPVPAPATAYLLTGVPTREGDIACELCTPTGAALLRYFCNSFGRRPDMAVSVVGYGMGAKEFPDRPNCVRAFLGEESGMSTDELCELRCNVDDMTPEAASFAAERIMASGARDVYIQQVLMKKGRPGFVFVCLCDAPDADKFTELLLRYTTTLGVRRFPCVRAALSREISEEETPYGKVRVKISSGCGVRRVKAEYDDLSAIAIERGLSITETERLIGSWIV